MGRLAATQVDHQGRAAHVEEPAFAYYLAIDIWKAVDEESMSVKDRLIDGGFDLHGTVPDAVTATIAEPSGQPVRRVEGVGGDGSVVERPRDRRRRRGDAADGLGRDRYGFVFGIAGQIVE